MRLRRLFVKYVSISPYHGAHHVANLPSRTPLPVQLDVLAEESVSRAARLVFGKSGRQAFEVICVYWSLHLNQGKILE